MKKVPIWVLVYQCGFPTKVYSSIPSSVTYQAMVGFTIVSSQ